MATEKKTFLSYGIMKNNIYQEIFCYFNLKFTGLKYGLRTRWKLVE